MTLKSNKNNYKIEIIYFILLKHKWDIMKRIDTII